MAILTTLFLSVAAQRGFVRDVKEKLRYLRGLRHSASKMNEEKTYEPPDENFITIGAEHFRCAEVLLLLDLVLYILLHCHRREGDSSECPKEIALHRFGLLHRAHIDCQGEDLRSPRRNHFLCR